MEPFLQNISFCVLFLTMLFFLIKASFTLGSKEKLPTDTFFQKLFYSGFKKENQILKKSKVTLLSVNLQVGTTGIFIANVALGLLLTLRWVHNGYFPLSNLYESLMFLSWSFTLLHLFLEKMNIRGLNENFLGVITSPMALFTNAFANFSLPLEMQKANSLVPALQSNWLMMHVTVMMLSYAALLMGCVFSIAFLVISNFTSHTSTYKKKSDLSLALPTAEQFKDNSVEFLHSPNGLIRKKHEKKQTSSLVTQKSFLSEIQFDKKALLLLDDQTAFWDLELADTSPVISLEEQQKTYLNNFYSTLAQNLDNLSYRILGIGFPLLTLGILSGAVWANEAWGSYWSWDPKETWAFITWLVFAVYFHARITKGWEGKKPALLASLGFLIIWICYLGVNLIGKGLHSYGWITFN